MELFKTKQFVAALVWLLVVVLVFYLPKLEPAALEIAAAWTLIILSALAGVTWKELALITYTQAGVVVAATPSKADDKFYSDATNTMLAIGILKKTQNPDAPYDIDVGALETFVSKIFKRL